MRILGFKTFGEKKKNRPKLKAATGFDESLGENMLSSQSSRSDEAVPASTIKLSVLKLDRTSFNVVVPENASVGELRASLQKTVSEMEISELGYCDIHWDQVWGNFCLSYMNQKLLDDDMSLRGVGIQPDDQIEFCRHHNDGIKKRRAFSSIFARSSCVV